MTANLNIPAILVRTVVWIVLSTAGIAVGAFAGFVLLASALGEASPVAALVVGSLIFGAAFGGAQAASLVLAKRPDLAVSWLLITGVGFGLVGGFLMGSGMVTGSSNQALGAIQVLGALVSAVGTTGVQWLFLRPKLVNAWWWPIAGVVGLLLFFSVIGGPLRAGSLLFVGWLVYSGLTGLAMAVIAPGASGDAGEAA